MYLNTYRCLPVLAVIVLGLWSIGPAVAQEPTALQFAVNTEKLLVDAIASAEKSVVAIGRDDVRREVLPAREQFRLGGPEIARRANPEHLDYVHDEFAAGVVVDVSRSRTLILTNYHVLGVVQDDEKQDEEKRSNYYVTTVNRKKYVATIHAADPYSDLAILRIAGTRLKPIKLGDASKLRKGRFVIALGNPYSIARDGQASASFGIVANVARKAGPLPADDLRGKKPTLHHYGTLIQTDAKLTLGTSGGPLLNLSGEMVGLTTAAAALVGYEKSSGYAIPVDDTFRRVLAKLKKGEEVKFGFLGIGPANLRPARIRGGAQGIRVVNVAPGTPAAQRDDRKITKTGRKDDRVKGLRKDDPVKGLMLDDVITHVEDRPIYESDGLFREIGKRAVGSDVILRVLRVLSSGEETPIYVAARLTKAPIPGKKIYNRPPSWRGMWVDYPTAVVDLRDRSLRGVGPCVAIAEVEQDSPAWQAGLRRGMFVTRVGDTPVETPGQFRAALLARETDTVTLSIADPQRHDRDKPIDVEPG